jgi:thiol-disulfide isomerase/thioredoxin
MDKRLIYVGIGIIIAIVVVVVLILNSSNGVGNALIRQDNVAVPVQQLLQLKDIAMNTSLADAVGLGSAANLPVFTNTSAVFITNGKPTMLYIGADFCPYCAITRWGMVIAMLRFGNFTTLHYMTSSATDVYPNTPTFTFYNSSYQSNLISFIELEEETNTYKTLQSPTVLENNVFTKYDLDNPNVPSQLKGGIPFIDYGNISIQAAAEVDPQVVKGYDWAQIIGLLNNTNSPVTQALVGEANVFTAQICKMTNNSDPAVCSQPYIKQILSYQS